MLKFFQADEYERDSVGRVTAVVDRVTRQAAGGFGQRDIVQCYDYDAFNRLAAAWTGNAYGTDSDSACADAVISESGWIVDPTAFIASWTYDLAGQVTDSYQWWVEAGVEQSAHVDYDYDEDHPHAVESTGVGAYGYDAAGRMTSRDADGAGGTAAQTLIWDALSNLVGINATTGNERYLYDASGQRVVRIAGATATAYLGASEVTDVNTATPGALTGTRYYTFGATTVALRDVSGVSYLLGDVQGSASVLIPAGDGTADPDTVVASRNAYTPYGVTRGDDNLTTDRGWLGQVEDQSSGLTYLNARYYDPAIARFISPDPLMDPTDPRTLDPYRYADNNPVLFTDASGLAPSCAGLKPGTTEYNNCNNLSKNTYNYMTGKTTAKKNEELAKSGKAGVNKTTPKKNTSTKKSSHPRPHAANPKGSHSGACATNLKTCLNPGGGMNGKPAAVFTGAWPATRFALNVVNPINAAGGGVTAWLAMTHGGDCEFDTSELMVACYGASAGAMPGGDGSTVGAVFVSKKSKAEVAADDRKMDTRTIPHEAKHSDLQALVGVVGTGVLLGLDATVKYMKESYSQPPPNYSCNVVEKLGGYQDGGYGLQCSG